MWYCVNVKGNWKLACQSSTYIKWFMFILNTKKKRWHTQICPFTLKESRPNNLIQCYRRDEVLIHRLNDVYREKNSLSAVGTYTFSSILLNFWNVCIAQFKWRLLSWGEETNSLTHSLIHSRSHDITFRRRFTDNITHVYILFLFHKYSNRIK